MWLIQHVVPQGVVSLTQQLMPFVIVFVIVVVVAIVVVVVGGGGGGGVWSRLCVLRLVVYSWFCCPLNCTVCAPLSEVVLASVQT
jgi:hypothetical protein